jgi:hypothetical protein
MIKKSLCNIKNKRFIFYFTHEVMWSTEKKVLGKLIRHFSYTSHLSEVHEPNLMERNLSELTWTSFNSI